MANVPMDWPCVDLECKTVLGRIASGELTVIQENVAVTNTQGVNLVLTCRGCGRPKVWFAKAPAVETSFIDTLIQKLSREIRGRL